MPSTSSFLSYRKHQINLYVYFDVSARMFYCLNVCVSYRIPIPTSITYFHFYINSVFFIEFNDFFTRILVTTRTFWRWRSFHLINPDLRDFPYGFLVTCLIGLLNAYARRLRFIIIISLITSYCHPLMGSNRLSVYTILCFL